MAPSVTVAEWVAPPLEVQVTEIRSPGLCALIAAPRLSDEFTGVHRTFLTSPHAKKISNAILGRAKDSAIKIDMADSLGLGIGEGIETTIAARFLYRPMWSVMTAGGIERFPVLAAIEHLEIFADNDLNNVGLKAAEKCRDRWQMAGAEVAIVMPPRKGADIADYIFEQKVY